MLFTLGEALAVFLVDDGEPLGSAVRYRRTVAGSECNVAAGVVRLGLPARLVTTVGDDGLGDAVATTLSGWGIDAHVDRSARATGTLVRTLAPGIPAEAVHLRERSAATEITAAQVDSAWSEEVAAIFVTGITAVRSASARGAVERTVELARRSGALVVADVNLRPRLGSSADFSEALAGIRGFVDVAIGDRDELAVLADSDPQHAVDALLASGCRIVVTKLGAAGAEVTDGIEVVSTATLATQVVDTVGAGDAFAAGFIVAYLRGLSLRECLRWGSVVAADVVATAGDVEGLPSLSRVLESAGSIT